MHMNELILKKRNGGVHNEAELTYLVNEFVKGTIPDYQMSAWLMAVYFRGLTAEETAQLTLAMAQSGEQIDLSSIPGITVDKHSTGGVGDKTTFIIASIVAACGVPVAKMSGRGLGHTGGTIDKLESIPNVKVALTKEEFFHLVRTVGVAVTGQSGNLAPADKLLYALRDVTGTVDSIPLIASSVMSKKLAAGSEAILLDVKVGSGAFMKTYEEALALAETMVAIGTHNHRKTVALITDMDRPLGQAIGNATEMAEVVATLQGQGPEDLVKESLALAANMLYLGGKGSFETCQALAQQTLASGAAWSKFCEMVTAQGGEASVLTDPCFKEAMYKDAVLAPVSGYITHMDAETCGRAALILGAGRYTKTDTLDYKAGIWMLKKTGDYVTAGETIGYVQSNTNETLAEAKARYISALTFGAQAPVEQPLVWARVTAEGTESYI